MRCRVARGRHLPRLPQGRAGGRVVRFGASYRKRAAVVWLQFGAASNDVFEVNGAAVVAATPL